MVATGCIKLIARTTETTAPQLIELLERDVGEVGHVTTSGLNWVDIGAPQVSKAYALERVCDRLGIGIDEVVAVGDNHNDLSVLAWASSAMAPANAIPDVLAVVGRVLPPNSDDGVACLLEELAAVREEPIRPLPSTGPPDAAPLQGVALHPTTASSVTTAPGRRASTRAPRAV